MHSTTFLTIWSFFVTLTFAELTSRDIWQYPPNGKPRIKFYAVPNEYDDHSIKHADLIGSYHGYKNGEVWFVLKGKRLFQAADDNTFPILPTKYSEEIPIMTPGELKEVLKNYRSYEELHAEYLSLYARREALSLEKKTPDCTQFICEDNEECRLRSSWRGACDNCANHGICHLYVNGMPNWIGPDPS